MMRLLKYSILFVSIFLAGCSRDRVVLSEDKISNRILYLEREIKPYTGICIIPYIHSKNIKEVRKYVNGIIEGESLSYYMDGKLKLKGHYVHGKMSGLWEKWNNEGQKVFEATFWNDSMAGTYKEWYSNGKVKEEGLYKNNAKIGEWNYYNANGILSYSKNYDALAGYLINQTKTSIFN